MNKKSLGEIVEKWDFHSLKISLYRVFINLKVKKKEKFGMMRSCYDAIGNTPHLSSILAKKI